VTLTGQSPGSATAFGLAFPLLAPFALLAFGRRRFGPIRPKRSKRSR
jgi:hypothetical protein